MKTIFENVRKKAPLIHNITNYVTANDVANILLAAGASPIMADEPEEVSEVTAICEGLNLNMGTINMRTIPAMFQAAKTAAELRHPILLDPVGVGVSRMRTETAFKLLREIPFTIIRGNMSEIKTLAFDIGSTKGVDADMGDVVTENNLEQMIAFTRAFAKKSNCILAITGAIDLVADAETCYVIRNGRPEMQKITGTGCQLSGIMTAFVGANQTDKLKAAAAAVCAMGLAGEIGWQHQKSEDGNATYRNRIIDAVYQMTGEQLEEGAKYEVR